MNREETVTYERKAYLVGDLLDVIEARGDNSGDSDGDTDGGFTQRLAVSTTNIRKTSSCFPRLVNLVALDQFRGRILESEAPATKNANLNDGAIGAKRSVWADLRDSFVDAKAEVGLVYRVVKYTCLLYFYVSFVDIYAWTLDRSREALL